MILVFGKSGQVAQELQRVGSILALGRSEVDLCKPAACADAIRHYTPKAVINAAAYTAVDRAEYEESLATVINGDAPTAMAQACLELGIPLIHISTDYVFDGVGEAPWIPSDTTNPLNAYGRSKLAGEIGVRNSGAIHAILRTSWVVSAYRNNFVKTMLNLAKTRDTLDVVSDQIGGPTPARDIAMTCLRIVQMLIKEPFTSGTYHYCGTPDVSWADFARVIFDQTNRYVTINPIPSGEYLAAAKRPLNSRMDCSATEKVFGIPRPDWRPGLTMIVQKLKETS